MSVALFDLDRTLLSVNSGHLWVRAEWREGRIGWRDTARAVWWLTRYALGDDELDEAMNAASQMYAGVREAEMAVRVRAWFDAEVASTLRPGAREAVARHREEGHTLVLATTSSQWAARCAQERWRFDEALATTLQVADGRLTGRIARPAHGPHKAQQALTWAREGGVDLGQAWFYTDSYSDLPLLEVVGHPVVVHPDRRLAREARRRGWPIEDWGAP